MLVPSVPMPSVPVPDVLVHLMFFRGENREESVPCPGFPCPACEADARREGDEVNGLGCCLDSLWLRNSWNPPWFGLCWVCQARVRRAESPAVRLRGWGIEALFHDVGRSLVWLEVEYSVVSGVLFFSGTLFEFARLSSVAAPCHRRRSQPRAQPPTSPDPAAAATPLLAIVLSHLVVDEPNTNQAGHLEQNSYLVHKTSSGQRAKSNSH
ncbi:hypothetical protein Droror1_Dr00026550 [Drosera rotundifolia]